MDLSTGIRLTLDRSGQVRIGNTKMGLHFSGMLHRYARMYGCTELMSSNESIFGLIWLF